MITIATKDIAKQVRKELKAAYPSIKFSVTSTCNKISVSYVDGVPESEIKPFVEKYRGYCDLNTYGDYGCDTTSRSVMFEGQEVGTLLDYISVSRSMSERYLTEVLDYVKATLHGADTDVVEVALEDAPIKPTAIELYSKWVQDKIAQGQAAKIIAFDDWLEIAMMTLNTAIAL